MQTRILVATLSLALVGALVPATASAHCQMPCGIYGDDLRFGSLEEDFQTIEKAMKQIEELSKAEDTNYNQLVRWVDTKEEHADKIVAVMTNYFLMQRIKVPAEGDAAAQAKYAKMLKQVHALLVEVMKCTQTTDLAHVEAGRKLLHEFQHTYSGKK